MEEKEKVTNAMIFRAALALAGDLEYVRFCAGILRALAETEPSHKEAHTVLDECWKLLKEYADLKTTSDQERWEACIRDADRIAVEHPGFGRKMSAVLLSEIERLSKRGGPTC